MLQDGIPNQMVFPLPQSWCIDVHKDFLHHQITSIRHMDAIRMFLLPQYIPNDHILSQLELLGVIQKSDGVHYSNMKITCQMEHANVSDVRVYETKCAEFRHFSALPKRTHLYYAGNRYKYQNCLLCRSSRVNIKRSRILLVMCRSVEQTSNLTLPLPTQQ